jgi:Protein of unknown function (DUF2637)
MRKPLRVHNLSECGLLNYMTATATLNGKTTPHHDIATVDLNHTSDIYQATSVNDKQRHFETTPKPKRFTELRQRINDKRDMMTELLAASDKPIATLALNFGFGVVVAGNLILSFIGLYDFAIRVMGYPPHIAWLVPVVFDGATICAIGAIYRMRNEPKWRIRSYLWLMYFVPTLCSVAGNVAHAQHNDMSLVAVIGSGVIPIMVSLFFHGLIVVNRETERAKHHVAKKRQPRQSIVQPTQNTLAIIEVGAVANDKPATTPKQRRETTAPNKDRDIARRRVSEGATVGDILTELSFEAGDKSARRRIQRWTADLRR